MCWKCWGLQYGQCVKCARQVAETPAVAALRRSMAKVKRPIGRPPVLRGCRKCGEVLAAREKRGHKCGPVKGVCSRCRTAFAEHENPGLCDPCYMAWMHEDHAA